MKTNPNHPATPITNSDGYPSEFGYAVTSPNAIIGLTKREHFAGQMEIGKENYDPELAKTLMCVKDLPIDPIDKIKFWDRFEAMRKIMKADALIVELNRTQE